MREVRKRRAAVCRMRIVSIWGICRIGGGRCMVKLVRLLEQGWAGKAAANFYKANAYLNSSPREIHYPFANLLGSED